MLTLDVENIGDMAVIECKGRIVRSEAAFRLRKAVLSQDAQIVVLDLTDVTAIEGGGLGMLWFLQQRARRTNIQLKLFNPIDSVRNRLEHNNSMLRFDIASLHDMMALLMHADSQYAMAA